MRRGLVPSREQAQAAVAAGRVLVAGAVADKSSRLVANDQAVLLAGQPPRFVSRGGEKLDAALEQFSVAVAGKRALDAGASTGGFTDCLLQRGAASVVAVDVGRGQLHERLRADRRVQSLERTNIRHLTIAEAGGQAFELLVADLSFISLATVAPALVGRLATPGADLVVLVKPQFEAGRREVSAGRGVVRDPAVWAEALHRVLGSLAAHRAAMMGVMVSPLTGADGNVEFLAYLRAGANPAPADEVESSVARVVGDAAARFGRGD